MYGALPSRSESMVVKQRVTFKYPSSIHTKYIVKRTKKYCECVANFKFGSNTNKSDSMHDEVKSRRYSGNACYHSVHNACYHSVHNACYHSVHNRLSSHLPSKNED